MTCGGACSADCLKVRSSRTSPWNITMIKMSCRGPALATSKRAIPPQVGPPYDKNYIEMTKEEEKRTKTFLFKILTPF